MRSESFKPVILGLAFVRRAGCRDDGEAQLTEKPLLPTGTEIDLIRMSEATLGRVTLVPRPSSDWVARDRRASTRWMPDSLIPRTTSRQG